MTTRRGGLRNAAASLLWGAVAALLLFRFARRWLVRYEVEGWSMLPALFPGDWLLVRDGGPEPHPGDIVLIRDPRRPSRVLLKRVAEVREGALWVLGDNSAASTDSREFGWVPVGALVGRPWFRYWPLRRAGRV